ncbi:hypothetical protein IAU60_001141 [Kwoniella sp. DSM 27419]
MFAPRSVHVPRTYSVYQQPTTTKKNTNKENANGLPAKTPSRAGKALLKTPGTGLRLGLGVKTEGRDKNVLMQQSGMGKGKGKEEEIEPKRLFASASSKSTLPPSKSLSQMPSIPSQSTHNTHRTPAPTKRTYQALRTPAPQPLLNEPAPTPLPSATRTRRRSRQSLSSISLTPIKSAIETHFQTPAPVAWEEEVSLGSIEEVGTELQGVVEENEEEYGEIEYMPPPVQELPWTPAFEHADVEAIFKQLTAMPPLWHVSDPIIRDVPEFEPDQVVIDGVILAPEEDLEEDWLKPKAKPTSAFAAPSARFAMPKSSTVAIHAPGAPTRGVAPKSTVVKPTPTAARPNSSFSRLTRPTVASAANTQPRRPVGTTVRPLASAARPPVIRPTPAGRPGQRRAVATAPQRTEAKLNAHQQLDQRDLALMGAWEDDGVVELELALDNLSFEELNEAP